MYYNENIKYYKRGDAMPEWIDCRYMTMDKFKLSSGFQPKNSLMYIVSGKISYCMNKNNKISAADELVSFPDNVYFEREIREPITFYYIRFENPDNMEIPVGKIYVKDKSRLLSTLNYMHALQQMP